MTEDILNWDTTEDLDFFKELSKEDQVDPQESEETSEKPESIEAPAEEETKVVTEEGEAEVSLFDSLEEPQENEASPENTEVHTNTGRAISTVSLLKDKGFIDYELEDGEELTEEKAENLIEDKWESSLDEKIDELFEDVPKIVKDINKYVIKGGDINDFFDKLKETANTTINSNLNLEEESNQELVVRESLKEEGYDTEYINLQIGLLKDGNTLKTYSTKRYERWKEKDKEEKQKLLTVQAQKAAAQKDKRRQVKQEVSKILSEKEIFNGLSMSRKDKMEIPAYMTDLAVPTSSTHSITKMQRDLMDVLNDNNKSILLAKLLRNNFDLSSVERAAKTKVVKNIKKDIRRNPGIATSKSSSTENLKRSLADFFG